jgi:acetyl esterase/lipase
MKLGQILLPGLVLMLGCSSLSKKNSFTFEKNVIFKTFGDEKLALDLYKPDVSSPAPAVLVIHGGGWNNRTGDMHSICEDLARRGFVALNVTYRLAPRHQYPKALDDVTSALQYTRDNAQKFGIDPKRLYVWGYSAGGHLALLLGLNPGSQLKGIVAGGAPTNLAEYPNSPLINDFLGQKVADNPSLWQEASPLNHVTAQSPPVFLYHGEWDKIVGINQMWDLKAKLEEKRVKVEVKPISFNGHIGVYFFSQSAVDEGIRFLEKLEAASSPH